MANAAPAFGWDTVYAVRVGEANRILRQATPPPFPLTFTAPYTDTISVCGDFGTWQIAPGGNDTEIHFFIPLKNLSVTVSGTTTNLGNGDVTVQVELTFVPHTDEEGKQDGARKKLIVSPVPSGDSKPVLVVTLNLDDPKADQTVLPVLQSAVGDWLSANVAAFAHIFAVVDHGVIAAEGKFAWALPTKSSYAFQANEKSPDDSVLAILSMTENRQPTGLTSQVTVYAIPDAAEWSFLISRNRLLESLLLPQIHDAFQGCHAGDFVMSDDGSCIILSKDEIQLHQVPDDSGKKYDCFLINFNLKIDGEILQMDTLTRTPISPGIEARCSNTTYQRLQLKNGDDGKQTFEIVKDREPVTTQYKCTSLGVQIAEGLAGALIMVLGAVAAIFTDGAGLVVAIIAVGLLQGIIPKIADWIGDANLSKAPAISLLLLNCTDPVQWTGGKGLLLTSAAINDSMQLAGGYAVSPPK